MKARILQKSEEKKWDEFVKKYPTIHQTSKWGHFQAKNPTRGKYWIVVIEEGGEIIGGSMIIRHVLPREFCWFYSARGPILDYNSEKSEHQIKEIIEVLKPIAKKENAIFYRIDPPLPEEKQKKFTKGHINHLGFQPEHTLIINLQHSEKEILDQMKQKGRYNIRLAEKKGVKIRKSDSKNTKQFKTDIKSFHSILHETTMRDKFYGHKKAFYENMIETLFPAATLYLAEYKGKIIAGIIVTFYEDEAIYYYGASSNQDRNIMAPYLLQWHAIKEAKSRGCKYYDFLGIAPAYSKNHPWQGVTQFKKKFGGREISYAPPIDFTFKIFYYGLYRLYKWFKK